MKKSKKFLVFILSLAVITVTSISPTFSWLSAKSERVVNTFAGGAISIVVDEAPVGPDGEKLPGDRVTENRYKYVPGAVLDKDPTPTVLKGSDECYVFMYIENELTDKFSLNIDTANWKAVATSGGNTLYAYSAKVNAENADSDVKLNPIFTQVTVSDTLTAEEINTMGEKTLCATAYAVQTESMSSSAAIDLAVAQFMPEGTVPTYIEIA